VYNPTDKLSVNAHGGVELDEASGADTVDPVFGVGASYTIDADDTVSLDASRQTSSSAVISGQTVTATGLNLEGRHRIYGSFSIACSVGYQYEQYYAQGLTSLVRTDDYIFVRPSLLYDFAEWAQVELAYEYHRDVSTVQQFDFGENVVSLELSFVF
jgi:uncharacterized protein (PEP-CTERM system associated)